MSAATSNIPGQAIVPGTEGHFTPEQPKPKRTRKPSKAVQARIDAAVAEVRDQAGQFALIAVSGGVLFGLVLGFVLGWILHHAPR